MAFGFKQSSYDAVLFVEGDRVVKEMLLSEFEAVLDGIVGEPDYAGKTCQAVYLKIDTTLRILGAVFFTIDFNEDGAADKHWNLPLNQLVETAAFGPELNGAPVRMACSSQCQIPWHQDMLWEPDLSATSSIFKTLDTRIKKNRLGLVVDPVAQKKAAGGSAGQPKPGHDQALSGGDTEALDDLAELGADDEARIQMARGLKKLRLHIHNMKTRHQQEVGALQADLAKEKDALMKRLQQASGEKETLASKLLQRETELEHLRATLDEQKLNYENQISDLLNKQGLDFAQLRTQFRQDLQQKLIAQTSELREKLEMRELELHYRQDKIDLLSAELMELKSDALIDRQQRSHNEIDELAGLGVHFVVTLPGAGPMNIPVKELSEYTCDPTGYLASRLRMDTQTYQQWLEHARHPACTAQTGNEVCCEKPLELVLPHDFIAGVSDRCQAHQHIAGKVACG